MRGFAARLALAVLALALAASAHAEAVRSQGTGSAPLPASAGVSPRSVALDAALADAVERVAAGLLDEAASPASERALREALGPNPARFALRYRTVAEHEQARAAGNGREIAVTVEAHVDRERVASALRRAGLLAQAPAPFIASDRIVVEPLPSWASLTALRQRLVELGAERVEIERVEPERVVLAVEARQGPSRLVAAVLASPPPGVSVEPGGDVDGAPRLRLHAAPPPPADGLPPIDTPSPKR